MSSIVERRRPYWQPALTMAIMFAVGAIVAIAFGKAPVPQQPWLIGRSDNPFVYYGMTGAYCATAAASFFLAYFRLPWVKLVHIRIAFAVLFAILFAFLVYNLLRA
jgi:hypothetical protein